MPDEMTIREKCHYNQCHFSMPLDPNILETNIILKQAHKTNVII
jgi:hypothetical protein